MFFKKKTKGLVVYSYHEACETMKRMGVSIRPSRSGKGHVINKNGLNWAFNGDEEGFTISKVINAPANWSDDNFVKWMHQKNFVVAIYDQPIRHRCSCSSQGGSSCSKPRSISLQF